MIKVIFQCGGCDAEAEGAGNARYENLKVLTGLVDELLTEIDVVLTDNKDAHKFSRKRAADHCEWFFNHIGIEE